MEFLIIFGSLLLKMEPSEITQFLNIFSVSGNLPLPPGDAPDILGVEGMLNIINLRIFNISFIQYELLNL